MRDTRRPKWLDDTCLVMAGQWHKARRVVRDSGGNEAFIRSYEAAFTEPVIERMRDQGINLLIIPFYFGFGVESERADMERARDVAAMCRKHGLRCGIYVQTLGSIMPESLCEEIPSAVEWFRRDQDGKVPVYHGTWRVIPCPNCEEFLSYIESRVLSYAVETVQPDLIHFDNFRWWGEPEACRCPRCTEAFRRFLEIRWPDQNTRLNHFGIESFKHVRIPQYHWTTPPWSVWDVSDPVMQAWHDYKCARLAAILERFRTYIQSRNPEIAIECNVDEPPVSNSVINRGAWAPSVYEPCDVFWTEERYPLGITADGILVSRIRAYLHGQATGNRVFSYTGSGPEPELALAESIAFNPACLGMVGWLPDGARDESVRRIIAFANERRDLYLHTRSGAEVAVLNAYHTLSYSCAEPPLQLALVEQVLIQNQLPFSTLFDMHIDRINRYSAVILPHVEALDDNLAAHLLAYCERGGQLILVGRNGTLFENRLRREQCIFPGDGKGATAYGQGAIHRVSAMAGRSPAEGLHGPTNWIRARCYDYRYWGLPANHEQLMEALRAACPHARIRIDAPETVAVSFMEQPEHGRAFIHLVQYGTPAPTPVICHWRSGAPAMECRFHEPGQAAAESANVSATNGHHRADVTLKRYGILEIPWPAEPITPVQPARGSGRGCA